jgi:hypothetical protein
METETAPLPVARKNSPRPMACSAQDACERCFVVQVTFSDGFYIAECEAIGLVTEEKTYEALVKRAWEIAPEIAEMNGIHEPLVLSFQQTQRQAA